MFSDPIIPVDSDIYPPFFKALGRDNLFSSFYLRIVLVWNDGSYEAWEPEKNGWAFRRDSLLTGKWPDIPAPAVLQRETHFVQSDSWDRLGMHVATTAALFAGRPDLAKPLRRHRDGKYRCPHCRKPYKLTRCFENHVKYDCKNPAQSLNVQYSRVPREVPNV